MFRRNFLTRLTAAGATGLAGMVTVNASQNKTVTYRVKGFSCITCAVGLDAMLARQEGIIRSRSSYADGISVIEFNPDRVGEKRLQEFIGEMGFTAEKTDSGGK
jgi:hypothetical protein